MTKAILYSFEVITYNKKVGNSFISTNAYNVKLMIARKYSNYPSKKDGVAISKTKRNYKMFTKI